MVKQVSTVTNLTRSGIADWLVQRVSAVILAAYLVFITVFLLTHSPVDYATWKDLFSHLPMRLFSLLALLALLGHAWVGLWTIFTDYIKCTVLRGTIQILIILGLIAALAWGIQTLWSL